MTYEEQYQDFLKRTGKEMSYPDWLELQLSGRVRSRIYNNKKVEQFNPGDELPMGEYDSIKLASKMTGVNRVSISRCINHPEKFKTAGGYVWRVKK